MGKTVTTYLITGDPKGTRYAFIKNKICQMFLISHSDLNYLNKLKTQISICSLKTYSRRYLRKSL